MKVEFKEYDSATDNYGWDDYTMTQHDWLNFAYKSVEVGSNDTVIADVTPDSAYEAITFKSYSPQFVSVSPQSASASEQIQVSGVSTGSASIVAELNNKQIAKFRTYCYHRIKKSVDVTVINEAGGDGDPGYQSNFTLTQQEIKQKLKQIFRQAVGEFDVRMKNSRTISFDLNHNGKLDNCANFDSPELKAIRDQCETDADYNIFLVQVESSQTQGIPDPMGIMRHNQKFGYVFVDDTTTIAHELGHGFGGLYQEFGDEMNIMNWGLSTRWRLRQHQWEDCQHNPLRKD